MTTTILQKLQEATSVSTRKCRYAFILDKLDVETQEFIAERIALPNKHPNRISYAKLSRVLKSEGHSVSTTTIGEHYTYVCACKTMKEATS
jgi:hypothetical protein